jgi:hypothetical protein
MMRMAAWKGFDATLHPGRAFATHLPEPSRHEVRWGKSPSRRLTEHLSAWVENCVVGAAWCAMQQGVGERGWMCIQDCQSAMEQSLQKLKNLELGS